VLGEMVADETADAPFEEVLSTAVPSAVQELLAALDPRERQLLCQRFGLAGEVVASRAELAARLGISVERVRQIEARAVAKLRPAVVEWREQGLV
ncbi:MAG: sigma factor-like helix-turn-helix DNA-binding protein, partial [Acidimicrobiales bacterium]